MGKGFEKKRVKNGNKWDSYVFHPLCMLFLLLAVGGHSNRARFRGRKTGSISFKHKARFQ